MSFVRVCFAASTRNEARRFISFDEIGTLRKLHRLRNTRKASETSCRNEGSLFCVSAPRSALRLLQKFDPRYFYAEAIALRRAPSRPIIWRQTPARHRDRRSRALDAGNLSCESPRLRVMRDLSANKVREVNIINDLLGAY
ncbi:hypothetical protein PUN28_008688 [Cardiocondyla obscurior]|uniref:Uncharacterized protein n=1 Tax=Cardiocondyla obscurior TaxID=286306 RepID=A0AAW2G3U0_9HYME